MTKKTTLTQSFVASLAIAFALNIVSCSHEQSKAGWDGVREGAASEQSGSADTAAAEGDKTPNTDLASTNAPTEAAANPAPSDDKKVEPSESLDSGAQASAASLMPEASANTAPTDGAAGAGATLDKKDDVTAANTPDASKDAAAAIPPVAPTPDSSAASSTDKSSTDTASATPAPMDAAKTDSAQPEAAPAVADSAQAEVAANSVASSGAEASATEQPAAKPASATAPAKKVVSRLPKFPTHVAKSGDQVLNRYYFIRSGDNAESVATKIFGNTQASQDLVKWNGGKSNWKPGQIIKYASPQAPADTNMVSFWEERNASPTAYQVKVGDTLSKIAQSQYGDLRSWTEIAVTNKMSNPDRLAVGTTLNLFSSEVSPPVTQEKAVPTTTQASNQNTQPAPKPEMNPKPAVPVIPQDAKAGAVIPPQAQATQPAPQAKSSMDPVERDPIADAPNANMPNTNVPNNSVNDLPLPGQVTKTPPAPQQAKANGVKEASMEVAHFVGQNLFMVALGMGALGFLFFMMLLKRRRSQMDSEF